MDGEDVGRCDNLELRCFHTHFKIDMENLALSKYCSAKWFFWPESDDINLHEIIIFCCLKSIYECINGFNVLKKPGVTRIIQK
jgi:hypothetical protein